MVIVCEEVFVFVAEDGKITLVVLVVSPYGV